MITPILSALLVSAGLAVAVAAPAHADTATCQAQTTKAGNSNNDAITSDDLQAFDPSGALQYNQDTTAAITAAAQGCAGVTNEATIQSDLTSAGQNVTAATTANKAAVAAVAAKNYTEAQTQMNTARSQEQKAKSSLCDAATLAGGTTPVGC
ncbi:hypothetical protein [Streptomyces sp. NBC_00083]|uniref:hypothetical protein n=1 Tax=Streptomyces sp. NBC_00083 TaxID=2975647 RepID=UPI0022510286|nr:hypothetical protein [Streptomyces sp. NBC_00083]MCX5386406.1 hypothetical protein [Streptomyces sp. NBC_00083]